MPFDDDMFDVVTCQAGAMFFRDVVGALREMRRVTRPGGIVAVQVFASASTSRRTVRGSRWLPGTQATMPCGCSGPTGCTATADLMRERCAAAGLRVKAVHDHVRPAYFPSVEAMVLTEVNATPLRDRLSPTQLEEIIADSHPVLEPFRLPDDRLRVPLSGYVLVAAPD